MIDKINVWQIIGDHWSTFRETGSRSIMWIDAFLFYGVPSIIAVILLLLGFRIDKSLASILITSLAIFTGLLFNLLVLIYDLGSKQIREASTDNSKLMRRFIKEVASNISYAVLAGLASVILLLPLYISFDLTQLINLVNINQVVFCERVSFVCNMSELAGIFTIIFNFLVIVLFINFLLTLFMVLQRVYFSLIADFAD